jgi:hypothetical protein
MFRSARGLRIHAISAACLVLGLSGVARADETGAWPNVDRRLGTLFPLAVAQSAARLETPECAAVLEDFRDNRTGRPLTERLAETGGTASEYLARWLTFTSGIGLRPCENSGIMAFTSPGSRVVFVCRDQFDAMRRKNEGLAANILIHEALHSLGLGENPPDSKFITARVQARCGR